MYFIFKNRPVHEVRGASLQITFKFSSSLNWECGCKLNNKERCLSIRLHEASARLNINTVALESANNFT